jgi:hypothetical protein
MQRDDDRDRDLDISKPPQPEGDLSTADWILCILCSGIGCIVGIVRLIQGKPGAGKMIGVSFVFIIFWNIVRFVVEAMMARP